MSKNLTLMICFFSLSIGLLGAGIAISLGLVSGKTSNRTVVVRGLAEREVDADLVIWPLTFTVAANDMDSLNRGIQGDSAKVEEFLTKKNVSKADIIKQVVTVDDESQRMYSGGPARPFRYIGKVTILIRSSNIEAVKEADRALQELLESGVLLVRDYEYQTQFLFNGLNDIKPEMIAEATQNARAAADQFAQDSGSQVGRIKTATQGLFTINNVNESMPEKKTVRVVNTVEYFLVD